MTRLTTLTCAVVMLLTPTFASAQYVPVDGFGLQPAINVEQPRRFIEIEVPSPAPGLRVNPAAQTHATPENTDFCGIHDVFYWYEEDENGNEIDGTRQWACTD